MTPLVLSSQHDEARRILVSFRHCGPRLVKGRDGMSLSGERKAIADRAILQTFERTSVAWQAIPHWDTHDPGQAFVRNDVIFSFVGVAAGQPPEPREGPFDMRALEPRTQKVNFRITLAQAIAPTPDALLASVIPRTVALARRFDDAVLRELLVPAETAARAAGGAAGGAAAAWQLPWLAPPPQPAAPRPAAPRRAAPLGVARQMAAALQEAVRQVGAPPPSTAQRILPQLLLGRRQLEDSGFRAPCCLISSTEHHTNLNQWVDGDLAIETLQAGANAGSVHRFSGLDGAAGGADVTLMLGRTQDFPNGIANGVSPGEEPVDLAISVPPSLEVIGENAAGHVELAVRIRYATRVKDERGVVVFRT